MQEKYFEIWANDGEEWSPVAVVAHESAEAVLKELPLALPYACEVECKVVEITRAQYDAGMARAEQRPYYRCPICGHLATFNPTLNGNDTMICTKCGNHFERQHGRSKSQQ